LFYTSFAGVGLSIEGTHLGLKRAGLGLGNAGLDYKTGSFTLTRQTQKLNPEVKQHQQTQHTTNFV